MQLTIGTDAMPPDISHNVAARLEELWDRATRPAHMAVAVSGGSDSMALAIVAAEWCRARGVALTAFTVDHGLRSDSAAEARLVGDWMAARDIDHHILKWDGPHPRHGVQEAARDARYGLLETACARRGIRHLLLGHQREDQLETLLLRLSKGSALQGLTAMSPMAERGRLVLLRPLLDCTRKSLRECLIHRHQDWCEDPGNVNPVYTRTRLGRLLADVTALPGSDLETVALAARRLQRADDALSGVTTALADAGMTVSPFGFVTFAADFFAPLHDELVLRIIERAIRIVRGRHVTYRLRSLENFVDDLRGGSLPPSVTIAGCQLQRRGGAISVFREAGRGGMPVESLAGRRELVWDDRFTVRDTMPEQPLAEADSVEVRVLGEIGWRAVTRQGALPDGISLPAVIRNSLPGLWIGGKLAAVPLFSHVTDGMGIAPGRFEMVFMHN